MKPLCLLPILISLGAAWAQPAQPPAAAPPPPAAPAPGGPPPAPPPPRFSRPPMERRLEGGRWWQNQEMVQRLGLTADQQKKMEDIFQQSRLKLIDLNAALRKEEAIMEPLMAADQPDEAKLLSQVDKVAQARAELEKANGRMLVGMRRLLTPDQWKKLQASEGPGGRGPEPRGHGGPGGPGGPPPGGRGPGGDQPQQQEQEPIQ